MIFLLNRQVTWTGKKSSMKIAFCWAQKKGDGNIWGHEQYSREMCRDEETHQTKNNVLLPCCHTPKRHWRQMTMKERKN